MPAFCLLYLELGLYGLMLVAMLGHKLGIAPFRLAFIGFALALLASLLIAGAELLILAMGAAKHPRPPLWPAAAGALLAGLPLLLVVAMVGKGLKAPRIHDVSTDLSQALEFVNAPHLRRPSENPLQALSGADAALHRRYYADIQPLHSTLSPEQAFAHAEQVVAELGWQLSYQDRDAGVIEAVDETRLFGFKDDVLIVVQPVAGGSRIDTRSASRVGVSDLGANAARIQRFQRAFAEGLQ